MAIRIAAGEGVAILENLPPAPEIEAEAPHELFAGKTLGVPYIPQMASNLCWAAGAQMVLHFFKFTAVNQCNIVDVKIGAQSNCCQNLQLGIDSFHAHCDVGCLKADVETIYQNGNGWKLDVKVQDGPLTFEQLDKEINEHRRPVEVGIEWRKGTRRGGHIVIVQGCDPGPNNEQLVFVNDPLSGYGQGQVRFVDLRDAYHTDGVWVSTWTELARPE